VSHIGDVLAEASWHPTCTVGTFTSRLPHLTERQIRSAITRALQQGQLVRFAGVPGLCQLAEPTSTSRWNLTPQDRLRLDELRRWAAYHHELEREGLDKSATVCLNGRVQVGTSHRKGPRQ
jgi:hypothetical protein